MGQAAERAACRLGERTLGPAADRGYSCAPPWSIRCRRPETAAPRCPDLVYTSPQQPAGDGKVCDCSGKLNARLGRGPSAIQGSADRHADDICTRCHCHPQGANTKPRGEALPRLSARTCCETRKEKAPMKGIYPGPNGLTPAATWARISRPTGRSVTDFRPLSRSLSGEKRTLRDHPISVANERPGRQVNSACPALSQQKVLGARDEHAGASGLTPDALVERSRRTVIVVARHELAPVDPEFAVE